MQPQLLLYLVWGMWYLVTDNDQCETAGEDINNNCRDVNETFSFEARPRHLKVCSRPRHFKSRTKTFSRCRSHYSLLSFSLQTATNYQLKDSGLWEVANSSSANAQKPHDANAHTSSHILAWDYGKIKWQHSVHVELYKPTTKSWLHRASSVRHTQQSASLRSADQRELACLRIHNASRQFAECRKCPTTDTSLSSHTRWNIL